MVLLFGSVDVWAGGGIGLASDGVDDEVDNCECENRDDKADDGVKNGVFGVCNFFAVTARDDVAETAIDEHDNGNDADGIKNSVGDLGEDTVLADELGRHSLSAGGFCAFLDR